MVSIPLRGIWSLRLLHNLFFGTYPSGFNPLAGNLVFATLVFYGDGSPSVWFQSPCGEFGLCDLKTAKQYLN